MGINPALKTLPGAVGYLGMLKALSPHLIISFALQAQISFRNTHSTDSISIGKNFYDV